jgi:spore maturation protein CgeB
MRFVILNHSYDQFLSWLYESKPDLAQRDFFTQINTYYQTLFGSSDFWTHALRTLGHDVDEFVCNNRHAQKAWLSEHQSKSTQPHHSPKRMGSLAKWLARGGAVETGGVETSPFEVLIEQVRSIRPDVLYNQSVYAFDNEQLLALKAHAGMLIGEHAAMPLSEAINYRLYDLIVSSFPPTIEWLRTRGVRAELNRLAFDPRVGKAVPETPRDIGVSFVGSFLPIHKSRLELVEAVAARVPDISVHGTVTAELPSSSPLFGKVAPALWGRDMYALLRRSTITINHHGDVPPFANNMRLYEATGMGCLLVTDYKDNLHDMFEPEREVVTYREAAECVDKILFYLDDRNRSERDRIAAAGQRRTLHEHTYQARMKHLVELIRAI